MIDASSSDADRRPPFAVGDRVIQSSNPSVIGEVIEDPVFDSPDWWVTVRFGGTTKVLMASLIEHSVEGASVADLARAGKWGTFDALRRAVAVERILRHSPKTVYSFNAQRIQLYPHQYKPLLKILETDDRRLLVADEVGLGKTIEAGLVLAEFEARGGLDRVLVICPSRLREKWRDEMQRKFRQDFDLWGSAEVREYVSRVQRTPERSGFRAIISFQSLRREQLLDQFLAVVPEIDFVIFDEAHHARNRNTSTFKMAREISAKADGLLLLTATPLHLGREDLFSLLTLIRPSEFDDAKAFVQAVQRNEGLVRAQGVARNRRGDLLAETASIIRRSNGLGADAESDDALLNEVIKTLEMPAPTNNEEWLELERLLERAHVLSNVFTRTKKRDAYTKVPIRRARWVSVNWTPEEHQTYCALAGLDSEKSDEQQRFDLGSIQRARQAASSIHGTLLYKREGREAEFEQSDVEDLDEEQLFDPIDLPLPAVDSKYDEFHKALLGLLQEDSTRKVMVFTFFVGTSKYLAKRLNDAGIRTLRIAGDVPSNPQNPERDERSHVIADFKNDPTVRVLVSTEVGSEGLDFQFCSCLINYDLPWNPMVVEQRIGRIDRLGQKADTLHILSLVVEDTVEDRILERLYRRIDICARSVGDLESILGEELGDLRRSFYSGRLTTAEFERKMADADKALSRRIQELKELEQTASQLLGHEDYIKDEIGRVQRLGRYLTSSQIRAVIDGYLETHFGDIRVVEEGEGILRINVTQPLLQAVEEATNTFGERGVALRVRARRGFIRATTEGERAYADEGLDILNANHPLVRTAALSMKGLLEQPQARLGSVRLRRQHLDDKDCFESGTYFLAVFPLTIGNPSSRNKQKRLLEVIAIPTGGGAPLGAENAERLLHLCLENGEQPPDVQALPAMTTDAWDAMGAECRQRARIRQAREDQDNSSLFARRKRRLLDERDRKLESARKRLATLRARDRAAKMIDLTQADIDGLQAKYGRRLRALEGQGACESDFDRDPSTCCCVVIQ